MNINNYRKLIIGLGNIGDMYNNTRHNVGFDVIDSIYQMYNKNIVKKFEKKKFGYILKFKFLKNEIFLLKPSTNMNNSGKSVFYWINKKNILPNNFIVITDDLYRQIGKIKIKHIGGHGGHKGLKSIQEILQTRIYNRLQIGIGNNFIKGFQKEYVLSKWSQKEYSTIKLIIELSAKAVILFSMYDINHIMNKFNSINIKY